MSVSFRTKRNHYDLGPTLHFMRFVSEVASIGGYPHLERMLDMNEDATNSKNRGFLVSEARAILVEGKLTEHSTWVAQQIAEFK